MSLDVYNLINDQYKRNLQTNNPASQVLEIDNTKSLIEIMNSINSYFSSGELHSIRYLFALFLYKLEENLESHQNSFDYFVFIAGNAAYYHDELDKILPAFDSIIELKLSELNEIPEIIKWCKPAKILQDYIIKIGKNYEFDCFMEATIRLNHLVLTLTECGNDAKIKEYCVLLSSQISEAYSNGIDVSLLRTTIILPICDYITENLNLDQINPQNTYQESFIQPHRKILSQLQSISENDQNNKKYVEEVLFKLQSIQTVNDIPEQIPTVVQPISEFSIDKNQLRIDRTVPRYADEKHNFKIAVFSGTYKTYNIIAKQYSSYTVEVKNDIDREIMIYETLSKISSLQNSFIKYYGTVYEGQSVILIMEAYPNNLEMKIKQMQGSSSYIPEEMFLKVAYKLVNSYSLLIDLMIVHRDVKSSNIVVDDSFDTRIIDFGSSIVQNQNITLRTNNFKAVGTEYYLAPEVDHIIKNNENKEGSYNLEKADVYSLGLVFIQLLTLWDITDPNFHKNHAGSYIDQCLRYLSVATRSFLKKMLTIDPALRPTFKSILGEIPFDPRTLSNFS